MNAGDICNRTVVVATAEESAVEAAILMREHHVGDVVVVERKDAGNHPVGILTDRDLVVGVLARAPDKLQAVTIGDVATHDLVTVAAGDSVSAILETMRKHALRRLPVVDDTGSLVGIVAFDDIVQLVSEQLGALATALAAQDRREEKARP